jgi:hypothetical protein
MKGQASAPRDAFPPTPPGPEGSNGNGLLRVQWVPGAWLREQTVWSGVESRQISSDLSCSIIDSHSLPVRGSRPEPLSIPDLQQLIVMQSPTSNTESRLTLVCSGGVAAGLDTLKCSDLREGMRSN